MLSYHFHLSFFSLTVTYTTKSGGFRKLYNTETNRFHKTEIYTGQVTNKVIEFKFDFIAPKHCSEAISQTKCMHGEKPINVGEDITKVEDIYYYNYRL